METKYLAAVIHGKKDMRMECIQIKDPKDYEVQISMGSVGICGSDIKYWLYAQCGRFSLTDPMVIGHEGSGTVVKLGSNVKHLKVGDRVAIEPTIPCRQCKLCKEGRYNLCPDVTCCATPPIDGNICRLYNHVADFCYKLPDNVSLDEGAMLEPLAVAVYGCQRGKVGVGLNVLICGADIDEHRLSVAKSHGADLTLQVSTKDCKASANQIEDLMSVKPDITLECSGSDDSLKTGLYCTKSGGCVVLIGRGSMEPKVPIVEAVVREVDIKGVFRYANCYPKALALVSSGQIQLNQLVTHHFPLYQAVEAFETAIARESQAIKVMIHCDQ